MKTEEQNSAHIPHFNWAVNNNFVPEAISGMSDIHVKYI